MRLLIGLLSYLIAAAAIVGCAAAFLFSAVEPAVTMVPAQQETRKVAPRIQEWLDRKAEGRLYAEREKAALLAEKERAEVRRLKNSSTAVPAAALARAQVTEREGAAQIRDSAKRDAKRQSRPLRDAGSSGSPQASYQQPLQYYPDVHGRQ